MEKDQLMGESTELMETNQMFTSDTHCEKTIYSSSKGYWKLLQS